MEKWVKAFDALDHHYPPEKCFHQIDAHVFFTLGKQPLNPVALIQ